MNYWWGEDRFDTRKDWNNITIEGPEIFIHLRTRIRSSRESHWTKGEDNTITLMFEWRDPPAPMRGGPGGVKQLAYQALPVGTISRKQLHIWLKDMIAELQAEPTLPKAKEIAERLNMEMLL